MTDLMIVFLSLCIFILFLVTAFFLFKRFNWLQHVGFGDNSLVKLSSFTRQQNEARAYLAHLLQLDANQLPPMGGWAASADFLVLVAEHVLSRRPAFIVEFGSGMTTLVVQRCLQIVGSGKLVTFENEPFFARLVEARARRMGLTTDIRCVELRADPNGLPGKWYDVPALAEPIDLMIVDGPPHAIHPRTRAGAARHFEHLAPGAVVYLDDARRPGETGVVSAWKQQYPELVFNFVDVEKGAVIGTRAA